MNRTKKGNVTAEARYNFGDKNAKFPIFDEKSAMSAIKLRHNSKDTSSASVLTRANRWAIKHENEKVKQAVRVARKVDKGA